MAHTSRRFLSGCVRPGVVIARHPRHCFCDPELLSCRYGAACACPRADGVSLPGMTLPMRTWPLQRGRVGAQEIGDGVEGLGRVPQQQMPARFITYELGAGNVVGGVTAFT